MPEPSTPRLPGRQRREQLFDIALELFSTKGYIQTSIDDIATRAGVTKPVFYQHFFSKKALYKELLEHVGSQLMSEITKAVAQAQGPRGQVESGFYAYFRYISEHENAYYLLFGQGGRREDEFSRVARRIERTLAEAVAVLIDAAISREHQLLLAYGIVGLAESTTRHWLTSRRDTSEGAAVPADPDVLARWIAEIAWGGLRGITGD